MRRLAAAVLLAAAAVPARALDWTPLGGITALGGLHAFDGDRGAFTGNADAVFAPAAPLTGNWSLLPSVRGTYEGTRRLTDVLGTATPAQERAAGRLGLRSVWASPRSRWRFKPFADYEIELLKETRDEAWGRGLFDQRRWSVGGEVEYLTRAPYSVRGGAAWFEAAFPNYLSLESQAALQFQGRSLARELVGDRVLDRQGWQFFLSGDAPLGSRVIGTGEVSTVWSKFPRQTIVGQDGQLSARTREDVLADASFSARMPHEWNADLRALGALTLGVTANSSNQNGYDASLGRFQPGFYDFYELRAAPSATLFVGPRKRPVKATLTVGWRRREYPHRAPQDGNGAYGSGTLGTTEWTLGAALSYPMSPRLSLLFDLQRASASSNQRFQQFYRYAYQATTALAGVRWDW